MGLGCTHWQAGGRMGLAGWPAPSCRRTLLHATPRGRSHRPFTHLHLSQLAPLPAATLLPLLRPPALPLTVSSSSPRRSPNSTVTMVAKGSCSLSIFTTTSGSSCAAAPLPASCCAAALRSRGRARGAVLADGAGAQHRRLGGGWALHVSPRRFPNCSSVQGPSQAPALPCRDHRSKRKLPAAASGCALRRAPHLATRLRCAAGAGRGSAW